ncbi:MAG: hypothetical protein JJU33_11465 [Phycisphaerales bacterium]|nr:hypothetical protein [Phycisphaerales bacterium]
MSKNNAKQTINGEAFAHRVRAWAADPERNGDPFPTGTVVKGEVDLRGLHCPTNLTLKRILFQNKVNLAGSRIEGWLDLSECEFERALNISETRIAGALRMNLARFPPRETDYPGKNDGSEGKKKSRLIAFSIEVGGDFWMRGLAVAGNANFYSARIGGLVWGDPADDDRPVRIDGDLVLVGANIGSWLDLKGAQITGNLDLWGARAVQGMTAYAVGPNRLEIGGDARLFRCKMEGAIDLSAASIDGTLYLEQAEIGGLILRAALVEDPDSGNYRAVRTRVACLAAYGIEISGMADLSGLCVMKNPTAGKAPRSLVGEIGAADFDHASIGDDLVFWTPRALEYSSFMSKADPGSYDKVASDGLHAVADSINCTGAKIGGRLCLDGLQLTGDLTLRGTTVGGEVSWRRLPQKDPNGVLARGDRPVSRCARILASGLSAGTDIDLSGVCIGAEHSLCGRHEAPDRPPEERDGVLDLRYAVIRGRCALYAINTPDGGPAITCVSGSFYADAASIGELVISGESFSRHASSYKYEDEPVVRLERARITRVRVVEPIPVRIDLTHIEVDRWELPTTHARDDDTDPSDERATPYCELLKLTHPKKRSNYIMFERVLRDRGATPAADAIYRKMREEFRPKKHQRGRAFLWWLHSQTGFGTQWRTTFILLAALAIMSLVVFALPGAVEEHPVIMGSKAEAKERWLPTEPGFEHLHLAPVEGSWDQILAAKAMVLRYHIPMIELPMYEDHRPVGWRRTYAAAMAIAHWIIIPLILASLIPAIIRRRENER